jgi:hypothetical protein
MGAVRAIHDRFGLPFSDEHKARISRFLSENPAAKRMGRHRHSPEQYGIDIGEVRERMAQYYDRFGELLEKPV